MSGLTLGNNSALTSIYCYNNNLTTLDFSNCNNLTEVGIENNNLSQIEVDNILTNLISFNKSGVDFDASNQNPLITPNPTLVSDLQLIWTLVNV